MAQDLLDAVLQDDDWGIFYCEVKAEDNNNKIKVCYVRVNEVLKVAGMLSHSVIDTSWMMNIDQGARRSYTKTASDTAEILKSIFDSPFNGSDKICEEFGELMVSMCSSRALSLAFNHASLPIAELWKPQKKQNEGFDFHTVCLAEIINFGEAKYSGTSSPHGKAITQANEFIEEEKHFRDRVHLVNLVDENKIKNLDAEVFGVVLAFSINAKNHGEVLKNAANSVVDKNFLQKASTIYIVGVVKDA